MPLWEYGCVNGHVVEVLDLTRELFTEMPCPTCAAPAVRLVSASSWAMGTGGAKGESDVSRAIRRVKQLPGHVGRTETPVSPRVMRERPVREV